MRENGNGENITNLTSFRAGRYVYFLYIQVSTIQILIIFYIHSLCGIFPNSSKALLIHYMG